jgi:CBS domain-containing protein
MLARDVMTTKVLTASADTDVRDIARMLLEHRISALPTVDQSGAPVGIVSEGDLMKQPEGGTLRRSSWWMELLAAPADQARQYLQAHGRRAGDVMTRPVIGVSEDTPLAEVAALLEKHRIKRVPVLRDGKLVGIVSRANLLQGVAARPPQAPVSLEDRRVREALLRALEEAGLPMHFVNATVADGVVQLEVQRRAARAAAEATPGVRRLEDNLALMSDTLRAAYGGL